MIYLNILIDVLKFWVQLNTRHISEVVSLPLNVLSGRFCVVPLQCDAFLPAVFQGFQSMKKKIFVLVLTPLTHKSTMHILYAYCDYGIRCSSPSECRNPPLLDCKQRRVLSQCCLFIFTYRRWYPSLMYTEKPRVQSNPFHVWRSKFSTKGTTMLGAWCFRTGRLGLGISVKGCAKHWWTLIETDNFLPGKLMTSQTSFECTIIILLLHNAFSRGAWPLHTEITFIPRT